MERVWSIAGRLGWHASFWASATAALTLFKYRLSFAWDKRAHDSSAADSILRHFECSWEEGELLRRTFMQDFQRKLESLFPVDRIMSELEGLTGGVDEVRAKKLSVWEELKIVSNP